MHEEQWNLTLEECSIPSCLEWISQTLHPLIQTINEGMFKDGLSLNQRVYSFLLTY